jgi:hypothetical protein
MDALEMSQADNVLLASVYDPERESHDNVAYHGDDRGHHCRCEATMPAG